MACKEPTTQVKTNMTSRTEGDLYLREPKKCLRLLCAGCLSLCFLGLASGWFLSLQHHNRSEWLASYLFWMLPSGSFVICLLMRTHLLRVLHFVACGKAVENGYRKLECAVGFVAFSISGVGFWCQEDLHRVFSLLLVLIALGYQLWIRQEIETYRVNLSEVNTDERIT